MKLQPKHVSALGLGITAVVGLAGLWFYKSQAAKSGSDASGTQMGSFPYFQSAALPSSITGDVAGSGGGSALGGLDINGLAKIQSDLQSHVSDNSLQTSWIDSVTSGFSDLVGSLSSAGFGTAGLNAALDQKTGGGFNFNLMALPIKSNATGPVYYPAPPTVVEAPPSESPLHLNVSTVQYAQMVNPPDWVQRWAFPGDTASYG